MFDIFQDNFLTHEKKIKELQEKSEEQEAQLQSLLDEHQVSKESLLCFLSDPINFDEETWKKMQDLRLEVESDESKLQVQDPSQTKQKYEELNIARNWILVR